MEEGKGKKTGPSHDFDKFVGRSKSAGKLDGGDARDYVNYSMVDKTERARTVSHVLSTERTRNHVTLHAYGRRPEQSGVLHKGIILKVIA